MRSRRALAESGRGVTALDSLGACVKGDGLVWRRRLGGEKTRARRFETPVLRRNSTMISQGLTGAGAAL